MRQTWNGPAGRAWVEAQDVTERMFRPFEEPVLEGIGRGGRVLDVGCGAGGTTIAAARRAGSEGLAVGIDISAPLIRAARARAEEQGVTAQFIQGDGQSHAFEPGNFDWVVSRFGVMFFEDPVRAFGNLRRAARKGAELRAMVWRRAEENPFMTAAERAVRPLLPQLPERPVEGPDQFAFADPRRVRAIVEGGGWEAVDLRAVDAACTLNEQDLMRYARRMGPVGRALDEADEQTREAVIPRLRAAFDPYVRSGEARFNAACWMVSARA